MPLRQIEIVIPKNREEACQTLLSDDSVVHYWQSSSEQSGFMLKVLVDAVDTEIFLDKVEQLFSKEEDYRLVMISVDATLPRIEEKPKEVEEKSTIPDRPADQPLQGVRVSREELYSDISDAVDLSRIYIALVMLSTIVAALGILRDNTAVVIGAMVIAPLLGPNVGLALSTTLADLDLGIKSLKTNLSGLGVAFFISILMGFFLDVNEEVYQIISRTEVHLSDISLALASGAAGVLAYTVGMSTAVIGVMVAVALLPPLVVSGLLLGDMQYDLALYSALLLCINVICVNLAGIATFILQGVRPRTWYDTQKAKKANKFALILWVSTVVILAGVIYFVL
ncbi:MAG: TIGR00341 family protein [Balneolaceae bacterium]